MQSLAFLVALLGAGEPGVSILLLGAQPTTCEPITESAIQSKCYEVNAGHPLRLKIDSLDEKHRIKAARYSVRMTSESKVLRSGQFIDSKGKNEWHTDIELPGERTTTYELFVEAESDGLNIERTFHIANVARTRGEAWAIAGTPIRLLPGGCWREARDAIMTLTLESCEEKADTIKAVVVTPSGLTLQQYVTNSIEVYSRREVWSVGRRSPLPPALGEGEMLELVQTIDNKKRLVNKYFLQSAEKIVVITRYYSDYKPLPSEDWHWIEIPQQ